MTSLSLTTGLKALLSSRFVLDTVGHNLANANTPGYSRQRVNLSSSLALSTRGSLVGSGVDVTSIQRGVDSLLARRINTQQSALGSLGARLGGLSELESFFGTSGGTKLSGMLDGFFSSVSDLATAPGDGILRSNLAQSSQTVAARFNEVSARFGTAERDTLSEVSSLVREVNSRAKEIVALNIEIAETQSTGLQANDLLDRRDLVVNELSQLIDVTEIPGPNGTVNVLVAGNTLVGSSRATTMTATRDNSNNIRIQIDGSNGYVPVTGGSVGGLMQLGAKDIPQLASEFDDLAKQLILSTNRVHSTGIPVSGPFSILTGTNPIADFDGDGKATDELISNAGLPFDVASGALYVNVQNSETGLMEKSRVEVSATRTTVKGFLADLNEIDHLSADVDASGRIRIVADSGYGFDFSNRLASLPDSQGSFGGTRASLGTITPGPYALADGDTLSFTVNPGTAPAPFTVTFDQSDFKEISQATADEVADAINNDPNSAISGFRAVAVDGSVLFQSVAEGAAASFMVTGGTSTGAFGFGGLVGATINGNNNSVDPKISGTYTGDGDDVFTFRPNMDGVIGTTVGLVVDVVDAQGQVVASLEVGDKYVPGTVLGVADGIEVEFGFGELSADHGDVFSLEIAPDSDTSDVLVALGINGLFTGSSASDIAVRSDLLANPDLIASSISGAPGDSTSLTALLDMKSQPQSGLNGSTVGEFYGDIISRLGFQAASAEDALIANEAVTDSLLNRRDQVSGVDVDEELVDLVAFEQAFQAASRFIATVNDLNDELLALI